MPKKRLDYTRQKHWKSIFRFIGMWRVVTVLLAVILLALVAWQFLTVYNADEQYLAEIKVVSALNMQPPTTRMDMASSMLDLHLRGIGPSALSDDSFKTMVDYVSQTGEQAWTITSRGSWSYLELDLLPRWVIFVLTAFSLIAGGVYIVETVEGKHYLADLPWRKPWVWGYVSITPVLWAPLLVSAVRMRIRPPVREVRPRRSKLPPITFDSDVPGAATLYSTMRTQSVAARRERFKEESERELAELVEHCEELGEQLRDAQREHVQLRATMAQVDDIGFIEDISITPEALSAEFNRLQQLPGVRGVRPVNDGTIELLVAATFMHEGTLYDLSTWSLQLSWDGDIETKELRSGVKGSWGKGVAPAYRSGGFCFGDNRRLIKDLLLKGQILEAATLAIQRMHSINPQDLQDVPNAFKKARI